MHFDLSAAWDSALRIFRGSWQLLLVLAGIFVLLPNLAFSFAMPELMTGGAFQDVPANAEPEQVFAQIGPMLGSLFLVMSVLTLIQAIGQMAMMAVTDPSRPTVGQSIRIAFSALPTMIGVFILMLLAYLAAVLVLMVPVGLLAYAAGEGVGAALAGLLAIPLLLVGLGYLATRLSMTMPAVILGEERNPVAAIKRSWQVTQKPAWRLFAYYALLVICYLVISMVFGLLFTGLTALGGGLEDGAALGPAMIVNLLFSSILAGFIAALSVAIFAAVWLQLVGEGRSVATTFD